MSFAGTPSQVYPRPHGTNLQNAEAPQFLTTQQMQAQQFMASHTAGDPLGRQYAHPDGGVGGGDPRAYAASHARAHRWSPLMQSTAEGTGTASQIVTVACTQCRLIKKKCDNGQTCATCRKKGYICTRPARKARKGRAPRGQRSASENCPPYHSVTPLPLSGPSVVLSPSQTFQTATGSGYPAIPYKPNYGIHPHPPSFHADSHTVQSHNFQGGQYHARVDIGGESMSGAFSGWQGGAMSAPLRDPFFVGPIPGPHAGGPPYF
ncbi:uncharacterized protein TRAVEDRAFT_51458 [Trametes versicolor FP-101664 SS1]|uniref:uncharacterized protein n=1 Tax=Trametes versicolor (strain FP-101664) TaxID=717944 RepID=UPI00046222A9|nr:uncharacterized protein TRAVEDRAFT_51458 [Trametes versicolor FP-101664 SS1]EIW55334.1 hypothetical protein TRAVEDRAFT_51458 [Trametes versicolor FP-101664 SS1]